MAYVWQHSQHDGNELILLLAIADFANEHGIAWPSIATLARRARIDERTAQRAIKRIAATGELRFQPGAGPAGTNLYQVVMQTTKDLFEGGGNLPPGNLPGVAKGPVGGGAAVPPEPRTTSKRKSVSGQAGTASPVAACFKAYQDGIRAAYNAEYPPSASANGKLANLVKTLGAEPALAVVRYYLQSKKPFYVTRRHALEVLVKDATQLWLEIQQASGTVGEAPKKATGYLVLPDGRALMLDDYPVGDHLSIARRVRTEYANMIQAKNASAIAVQVGAERRTFTIQEVSCG